MFCSTAKQNFVQISVPQENSVQIQGPALRAILNLQEATEKNHYYRLDEE